MASRWSLGIGSRRPIKVSRLLLIILFIGITLLFILQPWSDRFRITRSPQMGDGNDIILPENLEHIVLTRFDSLVDKGLILYEPSQPETYEHDGFQFQFRIIPFLDKKPISSPDSKDRKAPGGPLANPPTDEIITSIGPTHRLLLNKYCIYRPMLILPTTKYLPQTSDLDITDITAAWTVLHALTTPQLVIYNCGPAAGSSLGHKHLQIFPVPNSGDITLFPSLATSTTAITRNIPGVPFAHFIQRLPLPAPQPTSSKSISPCYPRPASLSTQSVQQTTTSPSLRNGLS